MVDETGFNATMTPAGRSRYIMVLLRVCIEGNCILRFIATRFIAPGNDPSSVGGGQE